MTSDALGRAYLEKARKRLAILTVLENEGAYSDVVREAQEIVELALKGALRLVGIEPPKFHDVGPILLEHRDRFPGGVQAELPELARISGWLRKERELAYYGDVDFVPTERYGPEDARRARTDAEKAARVCSELLRD
jgi:HEPN domain-containing protein